MAVERLLRRALDFMPRNTLFLFVGSLNSSLELIARVFDSNRSPCQLVNGNCEGTEFYTLNQDAKNTDVLDSGVVWMAAPKKRTSRKTKWLRHQRMFIKNREDIETCPVCGDAKLMNHLCGTCFDRVQKTTAEVLKDIQSQPSFWRPAIPDNLKRFYRR